MSRAQRLLRILYTLEAQRLGGAPLQAGALCWRRTANGVEVLLITSRRSGRWGIAKGWSLRSRALAETARREAWEEAGVRGTAENRLLGILDAPKRYRLVGTVPWKLALYPLEVRELAEHWPERGKRRRQWLPQEEAAAAIKSKPLAALIRAFSPTP